MKGISTISLLAFFAFVQCEPPVSQYLPPQSPSNNYLPPSSSYGAPSQSYSSPQQQSYQAPSNSYGPPRGFSSAPPSNSYGPPQGSQNPPSSSYGAPAVTSAIFSRPQATYGAPAQQQGYGGGQQSGGGGGYSYGNDENYGPAKYEFQYDVQDYQSGQDFGHMESRDGDKTVGRYYVLLPDGRKQIVNYEADENGYRPTITYEQTNQGGFGGYDSNAQSKFNGY